MTDVAHKILQGQEGEVEGERKEKRAEVGPANAQSAKTTSYSRRSNKKRVLEGGINSLQ